jgi:S-methylmethionine-dependent homocysteine/selenocysteine methylase
MRKVTVLDGGMGHMLRRLGVVIEGELGSQQRFLGVALANSEQPELVVAAHLAYIEAGATVITTNNYAVVPKTLNLPGGASGPQDLKRLTEAAADRAHEAIDLAVTQGHIQSKDNIQIAGCLPPLAASYRSDLVGSYEDMLETYSEIAAALAPKVDVLLCETMSTATEAKAAATAAAAHGLPVWVSWALRETDQNPVLWSGESVEEAVDGLAGISGVEKLLINCSSPESISEAMPILREKAGEGVEVGGYANGFVTVKSDGKGGADYNEDLTPEAYAEIAHGWVGSGATVIGGCCGVFPEHIAELQSVVNEAATDV